MRIAIFSLIPWNFLEQRPQAIARELAKLGHEVYYVEPFMFSRTFFGMSREILRSARIRKAPNDDVRLLSSPYFRSYKKYRKYYFLNKVLSIRIVHLIRRLKIDFAIALDPEYSLPLISSGVPHAYDHVDDTQYMDDVPRERYIENMNRIKKSGAFNIYIRDLEAEEDPKGLCIPNGCYPEQFFPIDCEKKFDAVLIGSIAKWCDMDSLLKSNKQILLIGPMDVDDGDAFRRYLGARKKNIYYIPEISKAVANLWLNTARVGLVPFKDDHPVVQYAMPVKILEYFLCNLPVVTFRNEGIERQYGDHVTYYSSTGNGLSLDEAIDVAMSRSAGFNGREFSMHYSWPDVVQRLEQKMLSAVKRG
jgi:glycosyltransferase involved in cell wall biosynthesis